MTEAIGTALPEQKSMSGFSRIWGMFFRPREVFTSLRDKPNWLLPFILVCLVSLVVVYVTYDARMSDVRNNILSNPNITEEQRVVIEERLTQQNPLLSVVFTPVGVTIYIFFFTLILHLVFNVILGGSGSFKKILSTFTYSCLVGIPEFIIKTPLILAKGSIEKVQTSLALFLPVDLSDKFYYNFLAGFDIFNLWQVLLISLGVSVIYNFTFKKSFTTVFILWLIAILVGTVLKTVFGGMFGM